MVIFISHVPTSLWRSTKLQFLVPHHCITGIPEAIVEDYFVFGKEGMRAVCSVRCTLYFILLNQVSWGERAFSWKIALKIHLLHSTGETSVRVKWRVLTSLL